MDEHSGHLGALYRVKVEDYCTGIPACQTLTASGLLGLWGEPGE